MAETLGTYYFQVAPSADGIGKEMENVLGGASESAGSIFSSGLTATLGSAGALLGSVTAAVTAMTGAVMAGGEALLDAATATAEYGDNIDKMSQKMGISAEAYQEWEAVMQHSGTSMETLKASMKTMAAAAEKGDEAFQALGISEEQVATMSQEDLFSAVITGLQGMEEGTERTYIASQLLGRGATELGALLNTSAEDTQAMKDRLHELGGVMSDEDVKAAAAFQDQLQDMTTGFEALQRNLAGDFLPSLTTVMGGVTDLFAGDAEKGLENISQGVGDFVENLSTLAPSLLSIGGNLVGTLVESVLANTPQLITAGSEQLLALGQGLVDAAPALMSAGSEILHTLLETAGTFLPQALVLVQDFFRVLSTGLSEELPTLIPMVVDLASTLISTFVEIMPEGVSAGVALLEALGEGIMASLPTLLALVPVVVEGLTAFITKEALLFVEAGTYIFTALLSSENVNAILNALIPLIPSITDALIVTIMEAVPLFIEAGFTLFCAIIDNLPGIITQLCSAIPQIGDALLEELAKLIVDFQDIGEDIMMGLADGIVKAGDSVVQTAKDVLGKIPQGAKDLFQINSPSKLFEDYGQYIDEGLAIGIEDNADMPEDAMVTMTSDTIASYQPATAEASATAAGQGEGGTRGDIVIPVYIGQERIDEIIVQANNRVNYVSGGR